MPIFASRNHRSSRTAPIPPPASTTPSTSPPKASSPAPTTPPSSTPTLPGTPVLKPFQLPSTTSLAQAQRLFLSLHPSYARTVRPLETLRRREFSRLVNNPECRSYLDYTGAGMYPESVVRDHGEMLRRSVWGNPHSESPSSQLSTHHATAARAAILQFFDADPEEYTVVFTANASAALRLVGESFPYARPSPGPRSEDEEGDEARSHLVLPTDAHNSVNGLREFARAAGAEVHYLPMDLHPTTLPPTSSPLSPATSLPKVSPKAPSLLVLTAQSNLSGLKTDYPTILAHAKKRGYSTLLDAAALAPTSRISLASDQAGEDGKGQGAVDALAISLYKMLGYPTGVGALVVRKEFLGRLRKRWFSGGSVLIVQAPGTGRLLLDDHARWEDGTIDFLALPAIAPGLQFLSTHMPALTERLPYLMHFTLSRLNSLRHSNGKRVVVVHSPAGLTSPEEDGCEPEAVCCPPKTSASGSGSSRSRRTPAPAPPPSAPTYNPQTHGALISLSLLSPSGKPIPPRLVEHKASEQGIHIRAGCMCNPGAASTALGLEAVLASFRIVRDDETNGDGDDARDRSYEQNPGMERLIHEEGVVRVSFGLPSSLGDAAVFVDFVRETFVDFELECSTSRGVSTSIEPGDVCELEGSVSCSPAAPLGGTKNAARERSGTGNSRESNGESDEDSAEGRPRRGSVLDELVKFAAGLGRRVSC